MELNIHGKKASDHSWRKNTGYETWQTSLQANWPSICTSP